MEVQLAALEHAGFSAANAPLLEELRGQLHALNGIGRFLPGAPASALAQIRSEVATSVAAAGNLTQQAQGVVTAEQAGEAADRMAELASARDDARRTTEDFLHDFYEKRIFDPFLHFDTPEDERAYREREAQRRHDIEDAKTKDTPQGDLRAANLVVAQLDDAKAHGADKSPDFNSHYSQAIASRDALANAISPTTPAPPDKAASNTASQSVSVDPNILAALKNSGVAMADQTKEGHGVTVDASIASIIARA